MKKEEVCIGWTTTASLEEASSLVDGLLKKKCVKCAQISNPIMSKYWWKGKLETEKEYRITLKFKLDQETNIVAYLKEHHAYEIPQWLWVRASGASPEYEAWICGI